ncbi:hypothetical protein B0H19DRAFT_1064398 [Mycena capillaripes]|nr:hypothetical protein B0H19DRAFT_1064398 [Mycena capillaripes]
MPSMIQSAGPSSVELQKLLLCLGVVFAFILTAFGLSKLTELLRTRRRAGSTRSAAAKGLLAERPPFLYTLPATGYLAPVVTLTSGTAPGRVLFPKNLKPRPTQDPRNGVIQYIKASPYLQHISAPRLYALRHQRRLCFNRPDPSPLRNVITANPQGKLSSSTVPLRVIQIQKPALRALEKTHQRTIDPFERPMTTSSPHPRQDNDFGAAQHIEIPACLDSESRPDPHPWSAISIEQLYRTADAVVGVHPDSVPLSERALAATAQTSGSFPWVASSGVGANFKFGLVQARGSNAGLGVRQPLVKPFVHVQCGTATILQALRKTPRARPLSDSRNGNGANAYAYAGVKKVLSASGKSKGQVNAGSPKMANARLHGQGFDLGKENENAVAVCY